MLRVKKLIGLAAVVAVAAALGLASIASAQTATPPGSATTQEAKPGRPGHGFGLHNQAALEAAAKALGMTSDELSTQLRSGKTLAAIAAEKGIDIEVVQQAIQAAAVAEAKAAIQQAVTDGKMDQAKADWLLQGLNQGYWGPGADKGAGPGFGPGNKMGGPGGPGGRGGPQGGRPMGPGPKGNNGFGPQGNNTNPAPNSNGTTIPNQF